METISVQIRRMQDSMRRAAARFLRPGETVQEVFPAMTYSGLRAAATTELGVGRNQHRIFAVTSDRILILESADVTGSTVRGVVTELPRSTRLGPPIGLFWHAIPAGDERLRVHRRFFKSIRAADAARSSSGSP